MNLEEMVEGLRVLRKSLWKSYEEMSEELRQLDRRSIAYADLEQLRYNLMNEIEILDAARRVAFNYHMSNKFPKYTKSNS